MRWTRKSIACAAVASIASRTDVRDDAYAPLVGRDGLVDKAVSSKRPSEKFSASGLDTNLRGVPVGQITCLIFEYGFPALVEVTAALERAGGDVDAASDCTNEPALLLAEKQHASVDLLDKRSGGSDPG